MGDVVELPLPAHVVAAAVDDPGHNPRSALAAATDAIAELGSIRILGRYDTHGVSRHAAVAQLRGDDDMAVALRFAGDCPAGAATISPGALVEVMGEWAVSANSLEFMVRDWVVLEDPDDESDGVLGAEQTF